MILYLLILLLVISNINSYLILSLNKEKQNLELNANPKEVIQGLFFVEIYAVIQIGSEKTEVKVFLTHERTELAIGGKNIKNHKYDESLSKSYFCVYNHTKDFYSGIFNEILLSKEDFYIKNDNKEIQKIEQLNFVLAMKSNYKEPYEGVLGLQLPYLNSENEYNIIRSLKNKKIINSYNWFLDFDNMDKGESKMYIGVLPHMINNKYEEKNFKTTYASKNGYYKYWGIEFSESYYGDEKKCIKKAYQAYIHFDFGLFFGPNELMNILDKEFFDYYINKNICFKDKYGYENNIFYYCKNTKDFEIKKFKNIYFKNHELENIFEFGYKDLFYYKDDFIYFLMLFKKIDEESYLIGEIFLKKYKIVFNQDSKTIGYYMNIKEKKENGKKTKNQFISLTNILLLLILIGIIVIGIVFYKKRINRKIRANELEENFQYIPKNEISNDINNKLIGNI